MNGVVSARDANSQRMAFATGINELCGAEKREC
jgi:hypothetical protein